MKRDMDLVRQILMEIEQIPFDSGVHEIKVSGHSADEISYHLLLARDAGLIEAADLSGDEYVMVRAKRLTYAGHEFLDAALDHTRWAKAKETVIKNTGALTLEALKTALGLLMKQALTGGM